MKTCGSALREIGDRLAGGLRTLVAFGAAALALALPATAPAQQKGGELVVGVETDVRGFDAVKGGVLGYTGNIVMMAVAEPLISLNHKTQTYEPLLATSWEASKDQKVWTLKLRPGVRFHDGTAFTAEDVAHHYNRILDPKNKARSRTFISVIRKVVAVDPLTVEFQLAHPWQAILPFLATPTMSGPIPSRANVVADKQNRHPVGTGPFRFVRWASGDRIVFERNPDYWAADQIHLDRIVFRVLPDMQTRFAALKSGEVDVIWTDRGSTILQAMKDPNLVTLKTDGAGAEIQIMNTRKPPLDDLRVRQAIFHALNREAYLKIVYQNTRPAVTHPLGAARDCGEAGYLHYNPKKARELVKAYGKPIRVSQIQTATPRGREIGQITQQLLKQVGIELELVQVDQSTLVKRVFTREFQMSGWRIADSADIGPQLFALTFSKSSYNLTGWSTPEMDKLGLAMRTALTMEDHLQKQCEMVKVVNQAAIISMGVGGRYHAFTTRRVHGVTPPYKGNVDVTRAWVDK